MNPVTVKDQNRVPELLNELKNLRGKRVLIGVFGKEESDLYLKASVNEYGVKIEVTPKMRAFLHYKGLHLKPSTQQIEVPERSFLRSTFDENLLKIKKDAQGRIAKIIAGEISAKQLLDTIGSDMEKAVKEKVRSIRNPPNHPFTIKQKTTTAGVGDKPLQDTGDMLRHITYEIR
jgi:hypothetical protein